MIASAVALTNDFLQGVSIIFLQKTINHFVMFHVGDIQTLVGSFQFTYTSLWFTLRLNFEQTADIAEPYLAL